MILGLFKSAPARSAEAIQTHINSLKGLDAQGLTGVALYCSYVRLAELRHIRAHASSETYTKFVWLYYRPLVVEAPFTEAAVSGLERSLAETERERRDTINPMAQGFLGLLAAATQAWRNTWLGCLYGEVRYLSQEMWDVIRLRVPAR